MRLILVSCTHLRQLDTVLLSQLDGLLWAAGKGNPNQYPTNLINSAFYVYIASEYAESEGRVHLNKPVCRSISCRCCTSERELGRCVPRLADCPLGSAPVRPKPVDFDSASLRLDVDGRSFDGGPVACKSKAVCEMSAFEQ